MNKRQELALWVVLGGRRPFFGLLDGFEERWRGGERGGWGMRTAGDQGGIRNRQEGPIYGRGTRYHVTFVWSVTTRTFLVNGSSGCLSRHGYHVNGCHIVPNVSPRVGGPLY